MAEVLNVQVRESLGKRNARRLRRRGGIPGVLYGHGQETISLWVPADQFEAALRHGSRLVTLAGAVSEQAFVRELQWDTWGKQVIHVDFTRVSAHERVRVTLPLELRGEAPGLREGGVLKHLLHQLHVECAATAIPDKLHVNINHLALGASITVGGLELPEGLTPLDDPDLTVVECAVPVEVEEEAPAEAGAVEPEVIGRKKEEEQEEAD